MKPSDPSGVHLASSANDVARLLAAHRASGRIFTAAGVSSFVLDEGAKDAEPVVCIHGVPASAYLYRKVLPALAEEVFAGSPSTSPDWAWPNAPRTSTTAGPDWAAGCAPPSTP